jgi:hypothetical protein
MVTSTTLTPVSGPPVIAIPPLKKLTCQAFYLARINHLALPINAPEIFSFQNAGT